MDVWKENGGGGGDGIGGVSVVCVVTTSNLPPSGRFQGRDFGRNCR